jgi:hypothetical protein
LRRFDGHVAQELGTDLMAEPARAAVDADDHIACAQAESARARLTPVSDMIVSVIAAMHPASTRSTRSRTAGSLRRSDSKTRRNASLS